MTRVSPTPDQPLNRILKTLTNGVCQALGDNCLGVYLGGSFAHGGWDAFSDVDFNIVIRNDLSPEELSVLKVLHARIFIEDVYYARHLEGAYFPVSILADLTNTGEPLWYLDNGSLDFQRSTHDNTLVNRWVLRERGVVLFGPEPAVWIPPIPEEMLKAEVLKTMETWGEEIFKGQYGLDDRFSQTFAILSYCRMLHTLSSGQIHSKQEGADWAKHNLDRVWVGLIDDALSTRENQYDYCWISSDPNNVKQTLAFIHYVLSFSKYE